MADVNLQDAPWNRGESAEAKPDGKTKTRIQKPARRMPADVTELWHSHLLRNGRGDVRPILANAIMALRGSAAWAGKVQFDVFRQRAVLRGGAPWRTSADGDEDWSGDHDVRLAEWLQHRDIFVGADTAGQAVETVAREHAFHPVHEYLNRLEWDGKPRLDQWAVNYLGAEDSLYCRAVAARWAISAVARVMQPGAKADAALILEGQQGMLKSTALKTLGHPWFTDEVAELGSKDSSMQVAGVWILELAELDSMSRADVSKVKAFMSRSTDRFRPPYGKRVIELPRQCVFAGTTNKAGYLRDETGGRRFWPIACTEIDIDGLAKARDQLWAEARARYADHEPWWLDKADMRQEAHEQQQARYEGDSWQSAVAQHVVGREFVTVEEVLREAIGLPLARQTQVEANRVARCLQVLEWQRFQGRLPDGRREWRYRPPVTSSEPVTSKEG